MQFWDAKFNKNKADHRFRVTLILRYARHFTIVFGLLTVAISRGPWRNVAAIPVALEIPWPAQFESFGSQDFGKIEVTLKVLPGCPAGVASKH